MLTRNYWITKLRNSQRRKIVQQRNSRYNPARKSRESSNRASRQRNKSGILRVGAIWWRTAGPTLAQAQPTLNNMSRFVKNYLQKTKVKVIEWHAQSPDLILTDNMWGDLWKNVFSRRLLLQKELKRFAKEKLAAIQASGTC